MMNKNRSRQIGKRIDKAMKGKGYTQGELGLHCGMYASQINKYINGVSTPSADGLIKLSVALDCTTDFLLKGI